MKEKSITLNDSLKDIINLHILKAFKKKKSFSNKYSSCEIIRISNLNWKLTDFKVFESIRFQKLKSQFFFVPNILHTHLEFRHAKKQQKQIQHNQKFHIYISVEYMYCCSINRPQHQIIYHDSNPTNHSGNPICQHVQYELPTLTMQGAKKRRAIIFCLFNISGNLGLRLDL